MQITSNLYIVGSVKIKVILVVEVAIVAFACLADNSWGLCVDVLDGHSLHELCSSRVDYIRECHYPSGLHHVQ